MGLFSFLGKKNNSISEDFIELCESGTVKQIRQAIKAGADVNSIVRFGCIELMALMKAAGHNENPEVCKVLIEAGANVNTRTKDGSTALMMAAEFNENPEVCKVLIEAGADINATMRDGLTALITAANYNKNPEVFYLLLDFNATVDVRCRSLSGPRTTGLSYSIGCNCKPRVVSMFIEAGADVNARDDINRTVLMQAVCDTNNPTILSLLIKAGADVNARTEDGWTPLMFASYKSNRDIISLLIEAGADVNAQTQRGLTALMWASQNNQDPDVICCLLRSGADPNLKDDNDKTACDYLRDNVSLQKCHAYELLMKLFSGNISEVSKPSESTTPD